MPGRSRRTELAVPGSNPRFIARAAASAADLVMLDLEDGVAPDARAEARQQIIRALRDHDWGTKLRAVRVNATSTPWFYDDLISVAEAAGDLIDVIILPKVEQPCDVYMLATLLDQIEAKMGFRRSIAIEAQIEGARAMVLVDQIATASRRLQALIFGPGDYAASLGMPILEIGGEVAEYPGHIWHAALSRIVVAAKAANIEAIDGPYGAYRDPIGLQRSAQFARALGCDGKWAIHPDQIAPINAIFTPTAAEIARARAIVDHYRAATDVSRGAIGVDGTLIDAASLKMAERVLAKAGLTSSDNADQEPNSSDRSA